MDTDLSYPPPSSPLPPPLLSFSSPSLLSSFPLCDFFSRLDLSDLVIRFSGVLIVASPFGGVRHGSVH